MKHKLLFILLLLFIISTCYALKAFAQQPACDWANAASGADDETAYAVAVDGLGNSYLTGAFKGTVDFDPSALIYNLTSSGNNDIFLAKYSSTGTFLWVIKIGGADDDTGYSIALDASEQPCITGVFTGTGINFNPNGSAVLNSNGVQDVFVAKYDANAQFIFAFNIGGAGVDKVGAVTSDNQGNITVTGAFQGADVDFDPSTGTALLNNPSNPSGFYYNDIFIAQYNNAGQYNWAFKIGGSRHDAGQGIATDYNGNLFVTGGFESTGDVDFNPGAGVAELTKHGAGDMFIASYTSSGDYRWAVNIGGPLSGGQETTGYGIAVSNNPKFSDTKVYITGLTKNAKVDYDPSSGEHHMNTQNGKRFVLKLDGDAVFGWVFALQADEDATTCRVAADMQGNVYVSGSFSSPAIPIDLDPGTGEVNYSTQGGKDLFIARYKSVGQYQWGFAVGGSTDDIVYGIVAPNADEVYVAGSFKSNLADFEPSANTSNLTATAGADIFLAKYSEQTITGIETAIEKPVKISGFGDHINIDASALNEQAVLTVYNIEGKEIISKVIEPHWVFSLVMTGLAEGIVTVNINNLTNSYSEKIFISK
jgi:hypothetical protein